MTTIAQKTRLPVGYSDHTLGIAVAPAAVALGAVVIEKHFTLDRRLSGPDHRASLEPEELTTMIRLIRDVERSLGSFVKEPTAAELAVKKVARRSITAKYALPAGHEIADTDIAFLGPATGISPRDIDKVIGRRLKHPIKAGMPLQWSHLG